MESRKAGVKDCFSISFLINEWKTIGRKTPYHNGEVKTRKLMHKDDMEKAIGLKNHFL